MRAAFSTGSVRAVFTFDSCGRDAFFMYNLDRCTVVAEEIQQVPKPKDTDADPPKTYKDCPGVSGALMSAARAAVSLSHELSTKHGFQIDAVDAEHLEASTRPSGYKGVARGGLARVTYLGMERDAAKAWASYLRGVGTHYAWIQAPAAEGVDVSREKFDLISNLTIPFKVQVGTTEVAEFARNTPESLLNLERTLQLCRAHDVVDALSDCEDRKVVMRVRKTLCVLLIFDDDLLKAESLIKAVRDTFVQELPSSRQNGSKVMLRDSNILLVYAPGGNVFSDVERLRNEVAAQRAKDSAFATVLSELAFCWFILTFLACAHTAIVVNQRYL